MICVNFQLRLEDLLTYNIYYEPFSFLIFELINGMKLGSYSVRIKFVNFLKCESFIESLLCPESIQPKQNGVQQ